MQFLTFDKSEGLNILCLGAHSDDIEIGAGGTLLHLFRNYKIAKVRWVVFASNETRKKEAEASAAKFLEGVPAEVSVFSFRDAFLQFSALEIKEKFEEIKPYFSDKDVKLFSISSVTGERDESLVDSSFLSPPSSDNDE